MYSNLEYLKEFIYDSDFKNLKIFSKQYFNSILYSMYKSNPDNLICFTFGDFNKLGQINKIYSKEIGDIALQSSLELIKENLPQDTIIARIAGDEFCFITPNVHKYDIDNAFNKIDNVLQDNRDKVYGLSITTSSIDSSLYPSLDDMYIHTELDVTRKKKLNCQKQFNNPEEMLSATIYHGLSNYFSYYRLESSSLPKSYYSILRNSIIDIIIHKLEKTDENMTFYMDRLNKTLPDIDFENEHYEINSHLASNIHNTILNNKNLTHDSELNNLFKFLITDPLTGQYSKKFFDITLLPILKNNVYNNIKVRLFDLVHLKLSNDIIGHKKTDEKINELFTKLVSQIKQENKSSKHFVNSGGTGLLLIEREDSAIPDDKIEQFINDSLANQRILHLVTASRSCKSSDIDKTILEVQTDCNQKKNNCKLNKINCAETILPLELSLNDSINYYIKHTADPYSLKSKQALVVKIFETLSTVIKEQFPDQTPDIFLDEK